MCVKTDPVGRVCKARKHARDGTRCEPCLEWRQHVAAFACGCRSIRPAMHVRCVDVLCCHFLLYALSLRGGFGNLGSHLQHPAQTGHNLPDRVFPIFRACFQWREPGVHTHVRPGLYGAACFCMAPGCLQRRRALARKCCPRWLRDQRSLIAGPRHALFVCASRCFVLQCIFPLPVFVAPFPLLLSIWSRRVAVPHLYGLSGGMGLII